MMIVGFDGYEPNDDIKELICKYRVGTVILFRRNIKDSDQLENLNRSLQQIAKDAGHEQPLFISIDQENGIMCRVPAHVTPQMPGAMTLGAGNKPEYAEKSYNKAAKYLRYFGIQVDYAPVADINSNPLNPVINIRSFGDDPIKVAEMVSAAAKGLHDGRVLGCLKHFPGHGDTAVDSHFGVARVDKTLEDMKSCELVPFAEGAKQKVDSIMMSHIIAPAMGDEHPASISPCNYKYLKETLNYDGYIVTDCLEMEAISETVGAEKGAELALVAGADGIMICHRMHRQVGGFEYMYNAVKDGKVSTDRIKESVAKIRALKTDLVSWDEVLQAPKGPPKDLAKDVEDMDLLYEKCACVVRGDPSSYRISPQDKVAVVYVGVTDAAYLQNGAIQDWTRFMSIRPEYAEFLKPRVGELVEVKFNPDSIFEEKEELLKSCDRIILATLDAGKNQSQMKLAHYLATLGRPLIVIPTLSPYDMLDSKWSKEFPNYMPLWEPTLGSFKAVAKILLGDITPEGKSPIKFD